MKGPNVPSTSVRVRPENLLQDCAKEEAWRKPSKEPESGSESALGGSSSDSSSYQAANPETERSVDPTLSLPADRSLLGRNPSNLSKNSVAMADVHKVVEGLTSFRAALQTNQRLTMQMLDREMEKVKQLPVMVQAEAASEKRSKEVRVRLPGALGPLPNEDFATTAGPLAKEGGKPLVPAAAPFAHLQTLDQKRKRRMSWIPKTGALPGTGTGSTDFETQLSQAPNVPQHVEPPAPALPVKRSSNSRRSSRTEEDEDSNEARVVAHLTKAEKAQAKREAEAFQEAGM